MEVHHCIHCGTESQPTWRFCRRCGTALEQLDQQPAIANCSNCSAPVADGWRFCANCGTGTDSATPAGTGLSEDDVADLIAAPAGAEAAPAESPSPDHEVPESEASAAQAVVEPKPSAEPKAVVADAPEAQRPAEPSVESVEPAQPIPAVEATESVQTAAGDHTVSEPEVSFEASPSSLTDDDIGWAAPRSETADSAPPPPPPDPLVDSQDIATAKAAAEAPPAPPGPPPGGPIAEVIEPAEDPFAGSAEDADIIEVVEEVVATAADDSREPAITIPHGDDDREIRSAVPRPIGDDSPIPAEIPRPIGLDRDEPAAAGADQPKRSVTVPDRKPEPTSDRDDSHEAALPPLDGRFRNPGLLGQVVQLMLIVSAALSVAMMVALVVLNNRLDDYATTGENLARVLSAESMVNTWMRPLLIGTVVITYLLLATWARRVVDNLAAFNNGMEETPLWMWMMPFVNMWVLFRHLDLAWKGSDYYARGARTWQRSVPDVWTILFVLLPTLGFVLVLYAWVNGADTFSLAIDSNAFSLIGYCAIALGLLAGVRSIANVVDRQRTRVEGIS